MNTRALVCIVSLACQYPVSATGLNELGNSYVTPDGTKIPIGLRTLQGNDKDDVLDLFRGEIEAHADLQASMKQISQRGEILDPLILSLIASGQLDPAASKQRLQEVPVQANGLGVPASFYHGKVSTSVFDLEMPPGQAVRFGLESGPILRKPKQSESFRSKEKLQIEFWKLVNKYSNYRTLVLSCIRKDSQKEDIEKLLAGNAPVAVMKSRQSLVASSSEVAVKRLDTSRIRTGQWLR